MTVPEILAALGGSVSRDTFYKGRSVITTFKVRFWEIADWAKSKDKKKKGSSLSCPMGNGEQVALGVVRH